MEEDMEQVCIGENGMLGDKFLLQVVLHDPSWVFKGEKLISSDATMQFSQLSLAQFPEESKVGLVPPMLSLADSS